MPEKGVGTLITAARRAGVPLRIAGTGPYEDTLKAMVSDTEDQIEFLGYCSGESHLRTRQALSTSC